MATAKKAEIYRWQAEQCWELAKAEKDVFGKEALLELAEEFNQAAQQLDREKKASH
jgi:hypothetical protein